MEELGVVRELWRYPASSFAGECLQAISVDANGIDGDRLFGLVEVATGEPARPDGDRRWHPLPLVRSRLIGDGLHPQIALPGGPWLDAPGAECDGALTAFLGFEVSLRPFTRKAAPTFAGPLTQPRYEKAAVHLLTTASLARLKALHPAGDPDRRRFRPSILVEMPAVEGSFPETEWIGRQMAIGDLELTVVEPCRRCGFTIIAQQGFDHDADILRNLVRHNGHNLGVYCRVDKAAQVEVGAPMRFL